MVLDPSIWTKHYWFFLNTIAFNYPDYPNKHLKKKYYDFFMNFPLYIPDEEVGNKFSELLDKFPISPYLDNKNKLIKWVIFIQNRLNIFLKLPEESYEEIINKYYDEYRPVKEKNIKNKINKDRIIAFILIILLLLTSYYFYNLSKI